MDMSLSANAPRPSGDRGEAIRIAGERVVKELELIRRCLNVEPLEEDRVDLSGQPPADGAPTPPPAPGAGDVAVAVSVRQETSVSVSVTQTTQEADPLALDLNGDGRLSTTGVEEGASFDLNGDGVADRSSFVAGGDAFLARDADGDGVISSGRELFGDRSGAVNGYADLARHDADGNGWIDAKDPVYGDLRLVTGAGEGLKVANTRTLSQAGIAAIRVAYAEASGATDGGDRLAQSSTFRRDDGRVGMSGDLMLRYGAWA
ncbi:MAG: hypothetical protein HQK87_11285 [Nitrospinae bacterium]|nr:hypothetical protein [Nitrospinota bacterium]